ncbi:MAG: TonB-dependent receptor plug domain-containing protein [Ignavibacterium sp.]|nr:TonB-dependent receptor plug domain-containing protein [Ignavibacterium sp.]MDW8375038.1 putative porin [Ignavibacteriales bacterium]
MLKLLSLFAIISFNLLAQIENDTLSLKDTLYNFSKNEIKDSSNKKNLIPLFNEALNHSSSFISKDKIRNSSYRYFGDLLFHPFVNIRDYGFIGYPNTLSLYGNSPNSVSILKDGILINERFSNYFNLNLIQTEEIDSIEIIPLTRGALYSSYITPSSVNIITKDFLPVEPYSRIRYYQGPDREAFVNGYFNAEIMKKIFFSFSITNRIKDAVYQNSDFSIWQGNFKLKYLLSNNLNLSFSYNINDYKAGFNGGIDYDSVLKLTPKPDDLFYDPIGAPVLLPNGKIKLTNHFPRITIKSKLFNWLKSDLNFFYLLNESEYKTERFGYLEEKVWGINSLSKMNFNKIELGLILDYEKVKVHLDRDIDFNLASIFVDFSKINSKKSSDIFSFGSYFSLKPFEDKFLISIFYKNSLMKEQVDTKYYLANNFIHFASYYSNNLTNSSIGLDLSFKITNNISVYLGYSLIGKYLQKTSLNYTLFESVFNFKYDFIDASIRYFINQYEDLINTTNPRFFEIYIPYTLGDLSGLSSDITLNYKFILFESTTNYFWKKESKKIFNIPTYSSKIGLFYIDNLFNKNLDLKAGVIFNIIGNQITIREYHNSFNLISTNPVQTIDFSLSGTIQKRATLFFTWENLFNKRYFLTPYYPMPERNIRFGVSWEFTN